ncbi:probable G-protein coupled receptor 34 isoform X1 [Myripristis murdjan]|uniref:probable G-protein coupled receptor 34 isoform X1 n=1 Tax=Myripristis murdjan TaxID=586833 RepID=UPI0011763B85|nr:probable G-protein coupled receptor 34 isoform X1 [Myripristis murdjan]
MVSLQAANNYTSTSSNSTTTPLFTSRPPISTMSSFLSDSPLPSYTSFTNQTCLFEDEALRISLALIYSLFFLFGLVGNLLALWVFIFLHTRRNSVRVLLINCAVADLVLLACLPFRVTYHFNKNNWTLGSKACKLVGNLFYMNMYISITLLGLISLDRYMRLRGRGRGRKELRRLWGRSGAWSWVVCGALWVLSLAGVVYIITTKEGNEEEGKCFQYKQRLGAKGMAYFNMMLVFFFWVVFVMLIVSYGKIAARLLKVSWKKPDLPNAKRYGRTAKKSFFVLFLFTICFGPYHAFRPVYILSQLSQSLSCDYLRLVDKTNEVMLLLSAFNSCLDPIMYFLLSGSVRKTALRVLGNRIGNRLHFLHEGTSISSTELQRPSLSVILPNPAQTPSSTTPRNSICLMNSTLRRTALNTPLPTGKQ